MNHESRVALGALGIVGLVVSCSSEDFSQSGRDTVLAAEPISPMSANELTLSLDADTGMVEIVFDTTSANCDNTASLPEEQTAPSDARVAVLPPTDDILPSITGPKSGKIFAARKLGLGTSSPQHTEVRYLHQPPHTVNSSRKIKNYI